MKQNRDCGRTYRVNIICDTVSEEHKASLLELSDENFTIALLESYSKEFIEKIMDIKITMEMKTHFHKYNLDSYLPDCSKVLYIDSDTIIRDPLCDFFDIQLDGCYALVCADIGAEFYPDSFRKRLGVNYHRYFNSGVMLLNLEELRKDRIGYRLWTYRLQGINHYVDQDAFNFVIGHNVSYAHFYWNVITVCLMDSNISIEMLNEYYGEYENNKMDYYFHARIMHFASSIKPWTFDNVLGSKLWYDLYSNSPMNKCALLRTNKVISKRHAELIQYTEQKGDMLHPSHELNK